LCITVNLVADVSYGSFADVPKIQRLVRLTLEYLHRALMGTRPRQNLPMPVGGPASAVLQQPPQVANIGHGFDSEHGFDQAA
jgi:hypothetical protein